MFRSKMLAFSILFFSLLCASNSVRADHGGEAIARGTLSPLQEEIQRLEAEVIEREAVRDAIDASLQKAKEAAPTGSYWTVVLPGRAVSFFAFFKAISKKATPEGRILWGAASAATFAHSLKDEVTIRLSETEIRSLENQLAIEKIRIESRKKLIEKVKSGL